MCGISVAPHPCVFTHVEAHNSCPGVQEEVMTCVNLPLWKCSMFTCCCVCLTSRVVCMYVILFYCKEK